MSPEKIVLTFTAQITSSDGASARRFRGEAYSGGVIPSYGSFGDAAIDLATIEYPESAFALINHDPSRIAGRGSFRVENNALITEGDLFTAGDGPLVAQLAAEGAPWQLSIRIRSTPEQFKSPKTVTVNNRDMTVSTVFRHAVVQEVSFVPIGADPNTFTTFFSHAGQPDMQNALPDDAGTISALQSRISELEGQVDVLQSLLNDERKLSRTAQLSAVFRALNKEMSDTAIEPYLSLSVQAFSAVMKDLTDLAAARVANSYLFADQAVDGRATPDNTITINTRDIYSKRVGGAS